MDKTNTKTGAAVPEEPAVIGLLKTLGKGRHLLELDEATRGVALKVLETGTKGTVTLTLTYASVKNSAGTQVFIAAEVVGKPPKTAPQSSLFFVDDDGLTTRNDPRQLELIKDDQA